MDGYELLTLKFLQVSAPDSREAGELCSSTQHNSFDAADVLHHHQFLMIELAFT